MRFLKNLGKKQKISLGRYTYRGQDKFAGMSLQLRIEGGGRGVMVINGNNVLHLNNSATAFAYFFMQGLPETEVIEKIRGLYKVKPEQAKVDYEKLVYTISTLAQTQKIDPVTFLEIEKEEPFSYQYTAPLRMDMALTFRCQNDCLHCYAGGPHETVELTTEQWKAVIDKLNEVGVFILTFTGGEPTLRDDLPELLQYAQSKGIVTGLITNGRKLKDKEYVAHLEKSGLDFVQVTLESYKPAVHDAMTGAVGSWKETVVGIKNVVKSKIYVSTNTTLSKQNADHFLTTIDYIHEFGVNAFGCNSLIYSGKAPEASNGFALTTDELKELLPQVRDKAQLLGLKFLWYTPTKYCEFDPVQLGLGLKSCTAAMINACIGPNGDVYPCQSYFEPLGNILTEPWEKIWHHPLAEKLRKREYAEEKCKDCGQLQVCGCGCPLELQNKAHSCTSTA
ncbi:MAG: radical SAM/SPASM domain-containing protein [Candidatus Bathyarchaeia archaeon]|jgi:radical SAM protein with 4Fe4S-binding SPASM domain